MPLDKRYTDLPAASSLSSVDIMAMVDPSGNITYQFTFAQLMTFLADNASLGAAITFGTAIPANTVGKDGDLYIKTSTGQFAQRISGVWTVVYTIVEGVVGNQFSFQTSVPTNPASFGVPGDVVLCTTNGIFYKQIAGGSNVWAPQFTIATGPVGPRGNSVLNGTTDPISGTGQDGDFYINTASNFLFGPKASGSWPTGETLTPLAPNTLRSGTVDPDNTLGINGDFYINTTSFNWFGPKASGVWPAGIPLGGGSGGSGNGFKIPITGTGLTITWQTDIPTGKSNTYAGILGNDFPKPQVYYADGTPYTYEKKDFALTVLLSSDLSQLITVTFDWATAITGYIQF